jgi:polysulfide reductase chain C
MELRPQGHWSWMIAAYLFLAGVGGGAYVTGVVADFLGEDWASIAKVGVSLGMPCVAIGCLFLIADLGTPKNFWRAFARPGTSWLARGTIIVTTFMVLGALHIALWLWPFQVLEGAAGARYVLGILGVVFALCTVMYTGILLGANRPIAFWSTAMVPLLFLVSALSTGVMAVILVSSLAGAAHGGPIATLVRADVFLIALEVVVLGFYLQATHRVPESRASARIVLSGSVAPLFWFGVVIVGLAIPLALEVWGTAAGAESGVSAATVVAAICGLIGGLCLRQVVLRGGIQAPLRAGRFDYALRNG